VQILAAEILSQHEDNEDKHNPDEHLKWVAGTGVPNRKEVPRKGRLARYSQAPIGQWR
jgi:hypothetical protein